MKIVFAKTIHSCHCPKIPYSGVMKRKLKKNTKTRENQIHTESSCPVTALITKRYKTTLNKEPFAIVNLIIY